VATKTPSGGIVLIGEALIEKAFNLRLSFSTRENLVKTKGLRGSPHPPCEEKDAGNKVGKKVWRK